jgi:spore maturation protein CgeB
MRTRRPVRLLIVGNRGGTNIGECFERAALAAGHEVRLIEARLAMKAPPWLRQLNWHLCGHRPTRLNRFSVGVLTACRDWKADAILTTGLAPLNSYALAGMRAAGAVTANYLTDDPWNPAHRAPWFMRALPQYSVVFSPRRANLPDLQAIGPATVHYLPFAYDPALHFVEDPPADAADYQSDVLFVGGADRDRLPHCRALAAAGLELAVYGDYWDRYPETKRFFRGYADTRTLRMATRGARVCLCLVRKANRDGHTMRTFEAAAMGGCLLVEDTQEHREIFGRDGDAVVYFRSIRELVERAKSLLQHDADRYRLMSTSRARVTQGGNTYADRLQTIIEIACRESAPTHRDT